MLVAIPAVVVPYLRWRTTHYVITTHRVMVRRGILTKNGKDITLSKITDVSFQQTLLDRIIRSGSLHIESAGDSPDENLTNIPRSNEVQQLINRLIDEDDLRRRAHGRVGSGRAGFRPGHAAADDGSRRATATPRTRGRSRAGGPSSPRSGARPRDLGDGATSALSSSAALCRTRSVWHRRDMTSAVDEAGATEAYRAARDQLLALRGDHAPRRARSSGSPTSGTAGTGRSTGSTPSPAATTAPA